MKFEVLQNFDWYNEPENVIFGNDELKVVARAGTDFWQNKYHHIAKDDGHFFHICKKGDFCCTLKWQFTDVSNYSQCGLMIRVNAENWFKVSIMSPKAEIAEIGHCLTNDGCSDWSVFPLENLPDSLWFKIMRKGSDYVAFYSVDGDHFVRLRQFSMLDNQDIIKAGAYICSPQNTNFSAVLKEINIS